MISLQERPKEREKLEEAPMFIFLRSYGWRHLKYLFIHFGNFLFTRGDEEEEKGQADKKNIYILRQQKKTLQLDSTSRGKSTEN